MTTAPSSLPANSLPPRITSAMCEVKRRLVARFGDGVIGVTLFGSWAWGHPHAESDIDLCVTVAGLTHRDRVEIITLVADYAVDNAIDLSVVAFSTERVARGLATEERLVEDIVHRGIAI